MSKRKTAFPPSSTQHLARYKRAYKGGGTKDPHYAILKGVLEHTNAQIVLYPGCHRHITPALFFPNVTFVDYDTNVAPLYHPENTPVQNYMAHNKVYDGDSNYKFHCCNVNPIKGIPNLSASYDLLISLSAGLLAEACTRYVQPGGYLLINDAHSDARTVFAQGDWQLYAYWDDERFHTTNLERCFQVIQKDQSTAPITKEQAKESVEIGAVRKRSFKLLFEPMFFLFQKNK